MFGATGRPSEKIELKLAVKDFVLKCPYVDPRNRALDLQLIYCGIYTVNIIVRVTQHKSFSTFDVSNSTGHIKQVLP